jgi:DNA repair exonuclease SbcCD nuclease subunit
MRILFLSDTHLGFDLPARPRVERRRRGHDFFRCFEAALAPALAGEVDAVVHGGDLLYRSRVPAWLVDAALAPLRRVADRGVPVLLLPGNHERSRLPRPLLARHERLHLFDRPRTVRLEARGLRVAFAGFPYAPAVRARFPALLAEAAGDGGDPGTDLRVLCLHQCVEGATCGPADFTFRDGDDVVRQADLPPGYALVLAGHVHRHQVLRPPGRPAVVYAGSTERTSFAEAAEEKGAVVVDLAAAAGPTLDFRPLPARPMAILRLSLLGRTPEEAGALLARAIGATPPDAVVQLRLAGEVPAGAERLLAAAALRALAGERTVWLARPGGPAPSGALRPAPDRAPAPVRAQASFGW